MKDLACADCGALHDFDLAPDTGTCIVCGGPLVEDAAERELVGGHAFRNALEEAAARANEALAKSKATGAFVKVASQKPEKN